MNKLSVVSVELNRVNIGLAKKKKQLLLAVPDCNIPRDKGITVSVHFTHYVGSLPPVCLRDRYKLCTPV